ncbi:MAG TPA: 1-deoxy-D-xylulose-5-phosphate reductoisomerase, partial [Spirochaetia bacterium]|nr:1-deoxy-D-xylulose-5-phosphate reductoisomerase [Spirochaetia bacterium]
GGAFRDIPLERLPLVSIDDALHHPTWEMGKKITIDSATMANKGLEVIEAVGLFGFSPDAIKVLIHPQSIVHSLIRTVDGALYTQISKPDMCLPIQNALTYPDMKPVASAWLDLDGVSMSFSVPSPKRYPLLYCGYEAARLGKAYPIAFNAANEEAVRAFLQGELRFTEIASAVKETLESAWDNLIVSFDQVYEADRLARHKANLVISRKAK